jgi:hypothetical protein
VEAIKTVRLASPLLPRHRNTRPVDHIGFYPRAATARARSHPKPVSNATTSRRIVRPATLFRSLRLP